MKRCIYPFLYLSLFFLCVQFLSPLSAGIQDKENPTDPESRMKSWDLHVNLRDDSPFKNLKWRRVGPMFQGGRIESIACPVGNNSTIFVGVGSGNVWKTVNNGITWKPIFENESTFTIGDIEVSRSDPDTVWVGMGENLMARHRISQAWELHCCDSGWK